MQQGHYKWMDEWITEANYQITYTFCVGNNYWHTVSAAILNLSFDGDHTRKNIMEIEI